MRKSLTLMIGWLAASIVAAEPSRPSLNLTEAGVTQMRNQLGSIPLFDRSLARVKESVDAEMLGGIETPVPRDYSGGYTHQRHKRNYVVMRQAALLYQILEEDHYAAYVRDMLLQYAELYPSLPLHPKTRSYARGRLFWQCLNDANWLLHAAEAYDGVYEFLSEDERSFLEAQLFRPFADHLSLANPRFFNRIHNHSTWGNAAVGMIGLAMDDDELLQRALFGLPTGSLSQDRGAKDDDGGLIYDPDGRAGFLANLDAPFSPDGYYTEGPYYQRYAMYPFLVFAQALQNKRPEFEIFARRDGVLLKAVDALLQLTDADGEFFPLNDAQKGMANSASSLVAAIDIAFHANPSNAGLLSVAAEQGRVMLNDAGFAVAQALRDQSVTTYPKRTVVLSDGANGDQGGVAVLRSADGALELVFKYTGQGLSHGHYDKLSMSLYEEGTEVLQDYGMVRFVNVEQKGGGNYLPENTSWAKQSIAHNTIVLDHTSHFGARYEIGSQHHAELHFSAIDDPSFQVVSARDLNAYPDVGLQRTLAMIDNPAFRQPIVVDLVRVTATQSHHYDLPFHHFGQLLASSFPRSYEVVPAALGKEQGYQHLFLEAVGVPDPGTAQVTWLSANRFYSLAAVTRTDDQWMFARQGANDPDFNLRRDPVLILRRPSASSTTFVAAIESHGRYSPVTEQSVGARPVVRAITLLRDSADYTIVELTVSSGDPQILALANQDVRPAARHSVRIEERTLSWRGPAYLFVE
ncbi:MAG: heparinase II/III family protein [Pseudomonadota bacterium]